MTPNIDLHTIAKISATLIGLIFVALSGFYLPNVDKLRKELISYNPLLKLKFPEYILITTISNLTVLLLPLLISFNLLLSSYLWMLSVMNSLFILYILFFTYHAISVTTQYFIGNRIEIFNQINRFVYFRVTFLPLIIFSVSFLIAFLLIHIRGWYLFLSISFFISFIFWAKSRQLKLYKPITSQVKDGTQIKKCIPLDILSWILLLSLPICLCIYGQSQVITIVITPLLIFAGLLLISVDYFIFRDKKLFFLLDQHPFGILKTSTQEFINRLTKMENSIYYKNFNDDVIGAFEEICNPIKKIDFNLMEKTNLIIASEIIDVKESIDALKGLSENPKYKYIFRKFRIF